MAAPRGGLGEVFDDAVEARDWNFAANYFLQAMAIGDVRLIVAFLSADRLNRTFDRASSAPPSELRGEVDGDMFLKFVADRMALRLPGVGKYVGSMWFGEGWQPGPELVI